jgi:hypothetical protein
VTEHIIFLFYISLFVVSTIGYGEVFSRLFNKESLDCNIGFKGLIGFFLITLISVLTSYFFAHNYIHNIIIHIIGIFGFVLFFMSKKKNKEQIKYFALLILIMLIGSYVYKNHDDFPYYHLTYSLNLSENKFIIGTGAFGHGFRTFSSLFYYHSVLYMPFIKFYLFHIGTFFIIVFFNYIILDDLLKNFKSNKINFLYYFKILCIIFINVAFYRISEHGTDRSAQILLTLIFLLFFDLMFFEKKKEKISVKINLLLILIFMSSSMKAIYYMYLVLVPIILINKNFLLKFFVKKNLFIILLLTLSITGNLVTNYFNSGCFLYPAEKTCVGEQTWSTPKEEVKLMKIHYEWWSKAGGGPGYKSETKPEIYIKKFRWVSNWIDRHFFNKVSDTLFGIIFICLLVYFTFKVFSKKKQKKKINYLRLLVFLLVPLIFLTEWFINHPSMRYGGYVLVGLPFFIITSFMLEKLDIKKKKIKVVTIIFVLLSFSIFFMRNVIRLNYEVNFYKYDILNSPYFYIDNVESKKILDNVDFKVYSTLNNKMCWASKTPCSNFPKIKTEKFFGFNVVYRDK